MNNNETRTLWISIGAALFAVFLLYSYTNEKSAELTKKFGAKKQVVVASRDINEMETLDESMVQLVERPADFTEPGAIDDPELTVGKVALAPIKKSEQILISKIQSPGAITGLSLQVAPSKRAISIPIDEMRGVSKLIKPGDRIDILASLDIGKGVAQRREVRTLMQDVVILATGVRITNELPMSIEKVGRDDYIKNLRADTSFSTITIEASPQEAQDLIYILSTSPSSLFLALRHPTDRIKVNLPNATVDSVMQKVSAPIMQEQLRSAASVPAQAPVQQPRQQKPKRKSGPFVDL